MAEAAEAEMQAEGSGTAVTEGLRYRRDLRSIGLLTVRFLDLIHKTKDGVLNLKEAADILDDTKKRRIYDVSNVLEGVGLIQKIQPNCVRWMGPTTEIKEFIARVERLKDEVQRLTQIEIDIDQHLQWLEQSLRNITEEPGNARYAYIRQEDICTAFADQTILALKIIPKDTQMDFPPAEKTGEHTTYTMHMKGAGEPIYGYLVNPELDAPSVILDFPNNYKTWLMEKKSRTSIISTRRQAAKRQAETDNLLEEPIAKKEKKDKDTSAAEDGDSDLIPVHQPDWSSAVVTAVLDGDTTVVRNIPLADDEDDEDDVAAELPDGFYSTSLLGPILRLSPPPTELDFMFTLGKDEGLCELYDIGRGDDKVTSALSNMSTIMEKINQIEAEMARTQKNKATAGHLGLLKARLAKLRRELITPKGGAGGTGEGFDVAKTGDARIGFVGFPSVGKSTLLTNLAGVYSEVAAYEFTTLTTVPGCIKYKGAKIQLLDLPGIIEGAKDGKGRGRQVIAVARTCSLIFIVLDVLKPLGHKRIIEKELEGFGLRLNKDPPNIVFRRKEKGGINLQTMVPQSELDLDTVKTILSEYRIHNADITLRYDATTDDLIDVVEGNRVYIPCIYLLNKIDQISVEELDLIYKVPHCVPISAHHKWNFDDLLEKMWVYLKLVRIYTKPKGQLPDYNSPVVLNSDHRNLDDFCNKLHRTIMKEFKYGLVWGSSVKHQPQKVGKDHTLEDEDVVQIVKKV